MERSAEIIASLLLEDKMSDFLLANIMHKNEQVRRKIMPELILSNVQLNDITLKLELLLRYGADINKAFDEVGNTPLIFAIWWRGGLDIVQLLLEHGADVLKADETGNIPLNVAKDEADPVKNPDEYMKYRKIFELLSQHR